MAHVSLNKNLILYFKKEPERDRFFRGDHHIIPKLRTLIKGKKVGSIEKVFVHLCKGFDLINIPYKVNVPFKRLKPNDIPIILGTGKNILKNYNASNPIIAGIGLVTHPSEWPELCKEYPVVKYLQHSNWAADVYKPYYGTAVCDTWFAGIETEKWKPSDTLEKNIILIYEKIHWDKKEKSEKLIEPIKAYLNNINIKYEIITYGSYTETDYYNLLKSAKAMIFLSEHESQGFACCEALSMNVPVFAWDQKLCLDPNRYKWGQEVIPATSVPFFDERCGDIFSDYTEFTNRFGVFFKNVKTSSYKPREYILENLTLEKSAQRMLEIIDEVY